MKVRIAEKKHCNERYILQRREERLGVGRGALRRLREAGSRARRVTSVNVREHVSLPGVIV